MKKKLLAKLNNVDYHIHSYYSDGENSPLELANWAKGLGLEAVALTDHDGVYGNCQMEEECRKLSIDFIPGIEISTEFKTSNISGNELFIGLHILGYGIDSENKKLLNRLREIESFRKERNVKLLDALNKLGYPLKMSDIVFREGQNYIGKPLISRAMVRKGYIPKVEDAFLEDGIFSKKELRKIEKKKIETKEAISLIHQAGGVAILAHPGRIRRIGNQGSSEYFKNVSILLKGLKDIGLDGIEAYYGKHSEEEVSFFKDLGEKEGCIITRGSDFHGDSFK